MRQPPSEHLTTWLGRQRWFAGRASAIASVDVTTLGAPFTEDELTVALAILSVSDSSSRTQHYLAPLAYAEGRDHARDPIYRGDVEWFDALDHPASARIVVALLSRSTSTIDSTWMDDDPLDLTELTRMPAEQSNTSLMTREHVIKVIRRLQPGSNPEVELGRALRGSRHVAPLSGWSRITVDQAPSDALVVHRRVPGADGFLLAAHDADRHARGEPEQHFPGAAYELGIAVGAVHAELIEAFGEQTSRSFAAELSERLLRRLDALSDIRVLDPYFPAATEIFSRLARLDQPLVTHRLHGDLHLGQTLFADDGWRLIDFEGEPRRPIDERRHSDSPMRDLAGMLRSFDYASRWNGPADVPSAWELRSSAMFLEGYRLLRPDSITQPVLDALVLDKALYEVGYETAHRPERLRIPLAAVAAMCGAG